MKRVSLIGAAFLLLLSGCRTAEEKNTNHTPAIPAAVDHLTKSEVRLKPYYYGLIEEYRTILAEDPNNLAANIGLANAYYESGTWREAIRHYEQALKLDPSNVDVRTDMGTSYRNAGNPDRALAEYRRAVEQDPAALDARYNMGSVYAFDFHDYRLAINAWEELLRLAPGYPRAPYMHMCLIKFKEAVRKENR